VADSGGMLVLFYDRAVALAKELASAMSVPVSALDRQDGRRGPLRHVPSRDRAGQRQNLGDPAQATRGRAPTWNGVGAADRRMSISTPDLYALSVRNHHARILAEVLPRAEAGIRSACSASIYKEEAVAGCLTFYHRDEILPYALTALRARVQGARFHVLGPDRRGAERGCRVFDFGRSKVGTGLSASRRTGEAATPVYDFYLNKARGFPT
jgi:hypothetical protein